MTDKPGPFDPFKNDDLFQLFLMLLDDEERRQRDVELNDEEDINKEEDKEWDEDSNEEDDEED